MVSRLEAGAAADSLRNEPPNLCTPGPASKQVQFDQCCQLCVSWCADFGMMGEIVPNVRERLLDVFYGIYK